VKQVGNGRIFMLLLYVDDILVIVDMTEAKLLKSHLMAKYGRVQFEMNEKLSYLGMEIEISNYGTSVGMSLYVTQLVDEAQEHGLELRDYGSLGTKETYVIKENAESVCGTEKVYFHSTVAKLLYIVKRAHPDILTVVMFLCTRVQEPRQEDVSKLLRVLGYLMCTKE
jgi:hypothetical protein